MRGPSLRPSVPLARRNRVTNTGKIYAVVNFLAACRIKTEIIILILAIVVFLIPSVEKWMKLEEGIAFLIALLAFTNVLAPYLEKRMRPKEYIYLAWVENMKSLVLLDYRQFEWQGGDTMIIPVPEPKHLTVKGPGITSALMLLILESWGEAWMGIEGMEPATRYHPNPPFNKVKIRTNDLDEQGDAITREYLSSSKDDGLYYSVQGIEWWNTAEWNKDRRIQIRQNRKK